MILTPEEMSILRQAIPIIQKIANEPFVATQGEAIYGMGTPEGKEGWGMWDGPTPDLQKLLKYPPPDTHQGPFYILQFSEEKCKKLYKWLVEEERWAKLKQK